jgi:serine protease Do
MAYALLLMLLLGAFVHIERQDPALETQLLKALVSVHGYTDDKQLLLSGTGFAVDSDGHIVTADHLVAVADHLVIRTVFQDYAVVRVKVRDTRADVALLQTHCRVALPFRLSDEDTVSSQIVMIPGFPQGRFFVATGLITDPSTPLKLKASLAGGSSGSPVLNEAGKVIGIVSGRDGNAQNVIYVTPRSAIRSLLATAGIKPLPGGNDTGADSHQE